jgi:UDP-glucose 4-epimerase
VAFRQAGSTALFGHDYPTGTGHWLEVFIKDGSAAGILPRSGTPWIIRAMEIFKSGHRHSYTCWISCSLLGSQRAEIPLKRSPPGGLATRVSYADSAKAREKLRWTSRKGMLTAVPRAWRWQKENPRGYGEWFSISAA